MLYHLVDWLVKSYGYPPGPYAYKDPLFRGTCAIILAFLVVLLAAPKVIRLLVRYKIGDRPEFDHKALNELVGHNKENTPTMGGVLIVTAILVSLLLLADLGNYYVRLAVFCMIWLAILGAVDDWLKLTVGAAERHARRPQDVRETALPDRAGGASRLVHLPIRW